MRRQSGVFGAKLGIAFSDHRRHRVIGQPGVGAHHRLGETRTDNPPLGADGHFADQAQPVHIGIERTQAVGQRLRQHRNGPIREIHRIAALARLPIQGRAGPHIVGHVGDSDQQPPVSAAPLAIHRVIEIAGGDAVNRHQRRSPQIPAVLTGRSRHGFAVLKRLFQNCFRPVHRNAVASDGDADFHAGGHVFAQHFLDPSQRSVLGAGLFDQFGDDDLTGLRRAATVRRDDDVLIDALVVGNDEADAAFFGEPSDHGFGVALQHLDHCAFAAAPVIDADHSRYSAVAMQQFAHLPGRQEQIVAALVGNQETVAFSVTDHPPSEQIHLGHRAIAFAAVADQLPVPLHGAQTAGQRLDFPIALQSPCGAEFIVGQWHTAFLQGLEDQFAAGNGLAAVFFLFPGGERIGLLPGIAFFIFHISFL